MGTRGIAQVAPTAGQVALNAYIYGYGGHSLVTPHAALKQLWWTDDRIDAKVTRAFVVSKLRGEERGFLDRPLAFGEGLTDDTYMEWILERAKRLFLILTEIGVPDQIFGCIDDSWDDDDLPVPLENVQSLELAYEEDEVLNKKFYDMQFVYLLRELQRGAHIDYGPKEHIPMEYVNTLPPAVSLQAWDRVHFPEQPDEIFVRRKFPLNDKETGLKHHKAFLKDVRKAQSFRHEHVASAWASYTSENSGYVLSDFVSEHTLRTFIDHRTPMQFVRVPTHERPTILLEWMHCLADALAFMHSRGSAHTAIRPSNILIDRSNRIAFAGVGSLRTFQQGKKASKSEAYDYAAPESQICRESIIVVSSPPISSKGAFSRIRKMSSGTSSSSSNSSSSTGSSTRSNSFCTTANTTPVTPSFSRRSNSITSLASTISPFRNFSRHLSSPTSPSAPSINPPLSPTSTIISRVLPKPTILDPSTLRDLPIATPEMSDIFSLACIYLDLITFLLRGKTTDFVKFRSQCSAPTHSYDSQPGSNLASSKTSIYSNSNSNNSPPQQQQSRSRSHNKPRPDASFHALDPSRLDAWLSHLRAESSKRPEAIFRCVPELLRLCKRMMAQNATVRPNALQVRDIVQVVLEADGNGNTRKLCCAGRTWGEEGEEPADLRVSGGVSGSVKRERERVQSCLMGLAQQQDGRASALSQSQGRGYGFGNERGEEEEEEEEEEEGGAAEAPDVPRERRTGSFSGSMSKGWKKAFGRMR
jgi:serine/threonine protein kinase